MTATVQVFYNGKIVTPMPLQFRAKAKEEPSTSKENKFLFGHPAGRSEIRAAGELETDAVSKGKTASKMYARLIFVVLSRHQLRPSHFHIHTHTHTSSSPLLPHAAPLDKSRLPRRSCTKRASRNTLL